MVFVLKKKTLCILSKEKDNASPVLLQGRQKYLNYFLCILGHKNDKMAASLLATELKTSGRE